MRDENKRQVRGPMALFCGIVFLAFPNCFGAELIEPTGTLQEPEKAWGGLSIFSGPPQTEIYLDGEKVGLREVETGLYTLNYILDFSWRI